MIDHFPIGFLIDVAELAGRRLVDQIEQSRKGVTEIEATAAAVADVEYPFELSVERGGVVELRILPVEGMPCRCLEASLAV